MHLKFDISKTIHWLHTKYNYRSLAILIVLVLVLTGCSKSNSSNTNGSQDNSFITKTSFLLNTICTINLYDKQDQSILDGCFDLISQYENIYSTKLENSELYALNHETLPHTGLTYDISDDMSDILNYGLSYGKLSNGVFDITIGSASNLWDFLSSDPQVPTEQSMKAALPLINYKFVTLNGNQVTFAKKGVQIDLGGIAKGYIADRVKDYLLSKGVKSAMINLGGNVLCVGRKPDGSAFKVGIQKPFADRNETIAIMEISDLSVVSSGIYERFFKKDGVLYHHILDPKTGFPVDNDLVAVTIVSKASVDGDGLSTTCFSLGLDKGLALIKSLPDTYAAFITKDYTVHYSEGFEKAIKLVKQ